ncbi:MAG: fibrobacter succinogenes major paralogous domain-containing protein [Bacteroidales bacterium]|nr:fibrobacter succinogenes major paralogous domain-containing protein [Bacteroidales bacterium]MBN2758810.1 fibrobacter succinogenes major paralogous domain-containing protein [Bacteroidales bacterium]
MIKTLFKKVLFVFVAFSSLTAFAQNNNEILLDIRDSSNYKTVTIANQVWMAQNLNFKTDKSWCYNKKAENCKVFGRLYNWDAAITACPAGWHLPSDQEWKQLETYLGMAEADLDKYDKWRGTDQGSKLLNDTTLGFNILLGGYRNPPANNNLINIQAFFWTSTEQNGVAWYRQFYKDSKQVFRRTRPKSWSFSVRCIKD